MIDSGIISEIERENKFIDNRIEFKTAIGLNEFCLNIKKTFFESLPVINTEKHSHSVCEFHYLHEGTEILVANEIEHHIKPKSYYIVGPNVIHNQISGQSDFIKKYDFRFKHRFDVMEKRITATQAEKNIANAFNNIAFFTTDSTNNIDKLLVEIRNELRETKPGTIFIAQSLFAQLFIYVYRDILDSKKDRPIIKNKNIDFDKSLMIDDYLAVFYNTDISTDELASKLNVSTRQLNRIINNNYNMSFKQKIIQIRIENAKLLLANSCLTVEKISEMVGYNNESTFYTLFKKITGYTPIEYRHIISEK